MSSIIKPLQLEDFSLEIAFPFLRKTRFVLHTVFWDCHQRNLLTYMLKWKPHMLKVKIKVWEVLICELLFTDDALLIGHTESDVQSLMLSKSLV